MAEGRERLRPGGPERRELEELVREYECPLASARDGGERQVPMTQRVIEIAAETPSAFVTTVEHAPGANRPIETLHELAVVQHVGAGSDACRFGTAAELRSDLAHLPLNLRAKAQPLARSGGGRLG